METNETTVTLIEKRNEDGSPGYDVGLGGERFICVSMKEAGDVLDLLLGAIQVYTTNLVRVRVVAMEKPAIADLDDPDGAGYPMLGPH